MSARLANAVLVGEKVIVQPLREEYAARAFDMLHGNEEILRWLVWDGPSSLEELEEVYARWLVPSENGDDYHFAILDRATGEFAGAIGPRFAGHPTTADVGYWLGSDYWGGGRMTEAVRLVDHLGFRHLGAEVMSAYVFVGNQGSRRVLESNGYRLVHLAEGQAIKHGRKVDEWYFTLLRRDFERELGDWRPVEETVEHEAP